MDALDRVCEVDDAHRNIIIAWSELKIQLWKARQDPEIKKLFDLVDRELDRIDSAVSRYRPDEPTDIDINALLAEHFGSEVTP
jgi:hypothetical protein